MTARQLLRLLALAAAAHAPVATAMAQDQTLVIAPTPRACVAEGTPANATIDFRDARAVIDASLDSGTPRPSNPYVIISVVRYKKSSQVVDKANWFVYNQAYRPATGFRSMYLDQRHRNPFTDTRIFGSDSVGVVYMHHNVPAISPRNALLGAVRFQLAALVANRAALLPAGAMSPAELQDSLRSAIRQALAAPGVDADVAAQLAQMRSDPTIGDVLPASTTASGTKTPEQLTDSLQIELAVARALRDAGQAITALRLSKSSAFRLTDESRGELVWTRGNLLVPASYLPIAYDIAITKKKPAPIQNLQKGLSLAVAHGGNPAVIPLKMDTTTSLCGGAFFDVAHVPSDIAVVASVEGADGEQKQLAKQTYDNEGKYWYDFSFALPLKSYQDLRYDESGGTVSATKVNKSDLFMVVNLGLPFDTKNAQFSLVPRLLYGMAIAGQPLKHHLLALAVGLSKLQLYGGAVFNRDPATPAVSAGSVEESTASHWSRSFVWGLNLPVSAVTEALAPKK